MWAAILWQNKRILIEATCCLMVAVLLWWAFIYQHRRIEALKADKAELSRQVEQGQQALQLLNDIQKRKTEINNATFARISTIRAAAVPRRAVLVRSGML